MSIVTDTSVEEAWNRVNAAVSNGTLDQLMSDFWEEQAQIADFLSEATRDLTDDAADIVYHASLVIWLAFRVERQTSLPSVSAETLVRQFRSTDEWLANEQGDSVLLQKKISDLRRFSEPNLMKYALESVFEAHEDGLEVDPSEQETVFKVLLSLVNSLS